MPESLKAEAADAEVRAIVDRQSRELRARRIRQSTEVEVLRKEIAGLQESIHGYQSQTAISQRASRSLRRGTQGQTGPAGAPAGEEDRGARGAAGRGRPFRRARRG